jgi:hypothetical protein
LIARLSAVTVVTAPTAVIVFDLTTLPPCTGGVEPRYRFLGPRKAS